MFRRSLTAAAALLALGAAQAQQDTLRPVTITDRTAAPVADVTGFGDVPLKDLPISATVVNRRQMQSSGMTRLADVTAWDSSVTDAYNAPGYWDYLTIRGFTLDNRFNYRREGLPISTETVVPLENKERLEILKGTSGIQSGTSAPGGLVNYVVKRPTERELREVTLRYTQRASVLAAADLGGRFGENKAFGYRLNVAQERLRPLYHNLDGERSLVAFAGDWRASRDSVLEGEFEWSHARQPSQAAYSILGSTLPAPVDPRRNLNNQPWSQPSDFHALTGTLRFTQALSKDWRWTAQVGSQNLKTDDRLAFPFGCSAEGNFDRYCSDGTFDFYDFRSENERRRQDAASIGLKGTVATGAVTHDLSLGLLASRVRNRFDMQAFNFVGIGNVQGTAIVPADPSLTDQNTNRDERNLELSLQDAMRLNDRATVWLGLRTTRLHRDSVRTDGSRPTTYADTLTTPWAALSYKLTPAVTAYASYGQGIESQVVPNRPGQYTNAGEALPALKSKQFEVGVKSAAEPLSWQLAAFTIERPMSNLDACSRLFITPCLGQNDGKARHRGIEGAVDWTQGPWSLGASATWLHAERLDSVVEPQVNGERPTNVPDLALRARAAYRFASIPALTLEGIVSHEGRRNVLPDGSIELPSWTRVDAALHYARTIRGIETRWSLGVQNLADRKYWKESPYQFGHVYLYPGAPRTLRLSFTASM